MDIEIKIKLILNITIGITTQINPNQIYNEDQNVLCCYF